MSKRVLVAAVLALAAAVGLWWWGRGDAAATDESELRPAQAAVAAERSAAELFAPVPTADEQARAPARAPERVEVAVPAPPDEEPALAPADGVVRLTGEVVVLDTDGVAHRGESGGFELVLWTDDRGAHQRVEVEGGRYETEVPAGVRLGVASVELGGRSAVFERGFESVPVPDDGVFDVEVRWLAALLLHVRARADGRALDGCTVLADVPRPRDGMDHPGDGSLARRLATRASSPVELPASSGEGLAFVQRRRTLHVMADGHAWSRLDVDAALGGERTIELDPGGALDLTVYGANFAERPAVRLRRANVVEGRPYGELTLHQDAVAIEGIALGRWRVSVEIGDWFRSPVVLASDEVEISASARAALTLTLEAEAPIARVPLAGTLVVAGGWDIDDLALVVALVGVARGGQQEYVVLRGAELAPIEGEPGSYAWRVEDVQPGIYRVALLEPEVGVDVEVGPTGREDVLVELGPPAAVVVRVVDAETGAELRPQHIHWGPGRADTPRGGFDQSLEAVSPDAQGCYSFTAPIGPIDLTMIGATYEFAQERFQVGEGVNELTFAVRSACGFVVRLRDGDTAIPWAKNAPLSAEGVDGDGRSSGFSTEGADRRVKVSMPGTYRFDVPRIDGYELVPKQEVVVLPGRYTEHVVELVRVP